MVKMALYYVDERVLLTINRALYYVDGGPAEGPSDDE